MPRKPSPLVRRQTNVLLSAEERELIESAAKLVGLELGPWMRQVCLANAKKQVKAG